MLTSSRFLIPGQPGAFEKDIPIRAVNRHGLSKVRLATNAVNSHMNLIVTVNGTVIPGTMGKDEAIRLRDALIEAYPIVETKVATPVDLDRLAREAGVSDVLKTPAERARAARFLALDDLVDAKPKRTLRDSFLVTDHRNGTAISYPSEAEALKAASKRTENNQQRTLVWQRVAEVQPEKVMKVTARVVR